LIDNFWSSFLGDSCLYMCGPHFVNVCNHCKPGQRGMLIGSVWVPFTPLTGHYRSLRVPPQPELNVTIQNDNFWSSFLGDSCLYMCGPHFVNVCNHCKPGQRVWVPFTPLTGHYRSLRVPPQPELNVTIQAGVRLNINILMLTER
jgi:hypothetical protein